MGVGGARRRLEPAAPQLTTPDEGLRTPFRRLVVPFAYMV